MTIEANGYEVITPLVPYYIHTAILSSGYNLNIIYHAKLEMM